MASGTALTDLFVEIHADDAPLDRKMSGLQTSLVSRLGIMGTAAGAAFTAAFTAGVTAGIAALAGGVGLGVWATKLASDAEEAGSKFKFVMGGAADDVSKQLDDFAQQAG